MRAEGYYWVKYNHNYWLIAEWDGEHWLTTGSGVLSRTDSYFDEIDERRIERDDPNPPHWKQVADAIQSAFNKK